LLADGHGSTRQLVSGTSTISVNQQYNYDAYGVGLGAPDSALTSYLYTGQRWDANAKQYYLRARCYDPGSGRFNQLDPFVGNNFDPQSLHKYGYAHEDPVNGADPSGEWSVGEWIAILAIAAIIAVVSLSKIRYMSEIAEARMGALEVRSNEVRIWIGHNYELRTVAVPPLQPKPKDSKDLFITCGGGESGTAIQGVADHDSSQNDPPFLSALGGWAITQAIRDDWTSSPDGNTLHDYLAGLYGQDNPKRTWRHDLGSARSYLLDATIAAARRKAAAIQLATGRQTNIRFILAPGYDIFVDGLYDVQGHNPIGEVELRLME
jgi:RHS repeat-associated protein